MTDKKSSESRRKLLKSIAAGSGVIVAGKSLPESWSRPVVDSVLLPAHAETSQTPDRTYSGDLSLRVGLNDGQNESLFAEAFNTLIPKASAGQEGPGELPEIAIGCAIPMGSEYDVWMQFGNDLTSLGGITGTLPVDGTEAVLNGVESLCFGGTQKVLAKIIERTDDYIDIGFGKGLARIPGNTGYVRKLKPECDPK